MLNYVAKTLSTDTYAVTQFEIDQPGEYRLRVVRDVETGEAYAELLTEEQYQAEYPTPTWART